MLNVKHKTYDFSVTCSAVALHWGGDASYSNLDLLLLYQTHNIQPMTVDVGLIAPNIFPCFPQKGE